MAPRYCSQCGAEAPQDKAVQNLYVCANGHQNWVNPLTGCCAYILKDGKVLFGVRSGKLYPGKLEIPGGILEIGESLEECAIRESKEELGVDIRVVGYLGSYPSLYDPRPILNAVFVAEIIGGKVTPLDDMGGGEPVWLSLDNLPAKDELVWDWQVKSQQDLIKWYKKNGSR
ncbi:MAG TPA: NUDIX hydrolase [Candidatus Saccharimonadales bacterium]|jgi:ADP-ribose pyrophosphatase YjhB (NUDIX family)|nr:NUDIX hydrolase [Candidatus Saccharimonadales bacterium]